jgi:hypothetical protein
MRKFFFILLATTSLFSGSAFADQPKLKWSCSIEAFPTLCRGGYDCFPDFFNGVAYVDATDSVQSYFLAEQNAKDQAIAACKAAVEATPCVVNYCVAPNGEKVEFR